MTPEQIIKLENDIDNAKKYLDSGRSSDPEFIKRTISMMESRLKYNNETDEDRAKSRKETRRPLLFYILILWTSHDRG